MPNTSYMRSQSRMNYPSLMNVGAGGQPRLTHDAIGRLVARNDERRQSRNLRFPAPNGVSAPKGPESYLPQMLSTPGVLPPPGSPQHPGGVGQLTPMDFKRFLPETGGRRPPSVRLQLLAARRKGSL